MRTDTFTFDGGHLVKVELLYSAPSAEFNYRGHAFEEILAGARQAYGPPTTETTEPTQDIYGVPYVAHRELWVAPQRRYPHHREARAGRLDDSGRIHARRVRPHDAGCTEDRQSPGIACLDGYRPRTSLSRFYSEPIGATTVRLQQRSAAELDGKKSAWPFEKDENISLRPTHLGGRHSSAIPKWLGGAQVPLKRGQEFLDPSQARMTAPRAQKNMASIFIEISLAGPMCACSQSHF